MSAIAMVMGGAGGWVGLAVALSALRRARRRLECVARAEHELRGPVAVLVLTRERMVREPVGRRYARAMEVELERLMAGLADLTAARTGRRRAGARRDGAAPAGGRSSDLRAFADGALAGWSPALRAAGRRTRFDWKAGRVPLPRDRGRVAQALGNLVANAAEHGAGEVEVRGRRVPGGVRVEVRNGLASEPAPRGEPERGRGLPIAVGAARDLGGTVVTDRSPRSFRAALELPVSEASLRLRERLAAGAPLRAGEGAPERLGVGAAPGTRKGAPESSGAVASRGAAKGAPRPAKPAWLAYPPPDARGVGRRGPARPPRPPAPPRPPVPPRRVTGSRRRM